MWSVAQTLQLIAPPIVQPHPTLARHERKLGHEAAEHASMNSFMSILDAGAGLGVWLEPPPSAASTSTSCTPAHLLSGQFHQPGCML